MQTIKIRRHRGSLSDAMETMKEIPATMEAVRVYLNTDNTLPFSDIELNAIQITPYGGPDDRIGWKATYMLRVGGHVVGFTDGPIKEEGEQNVD